MQVEVKKPISKVKTPHHICYAKKDSPLRLTYERLPSGSAPNEEVLTLRPPVMPHRETGPPPATHTHTRLRGRVLSSNLFSRVGLWVYSFC